MEEIKDISLDKVVLRLQLLGLIISHQFEEVGNDNPTKLNPQFFTPGEKICINQERASLRLVKEYLNGNIPLPEVVFYNVPEAIEKKIMSCLKHIEKTGWKQNINNIDVNP